MLISDSPAVIALLRTTVHFYKFITLIYNPKIFSIYFSLEYER